jgi:hypothetical protein
LLTDACAVIAKGNKRTEDQLAQEQKEREAAMASKQGGVVH